MTYQPADYRNPTARWVAFLLPALLGLSLAGSAGAGNIFDDNWTPPASRKDTAATRPAASPGAAAKAVVSDPAAPTLPKTAPNPPSLLAVPAREQLAKSRKLLKAVFAAQLADRSAAARRALAEKLIDTSAKMGDVPADQFVLLVGAIDAARDATDLALCIKAADLLGSMYDVDGLRLAMDAASGLKFQPGPVPSAADNCTAGLELSGRMVAIEDYDSASRLLTALKPIATNAGSTGAQVLNRAKEIDALRQAAEKIAGQWQALKTAPDDPAANLAVGQFLCFEKEDWDAGLPLLAKGSDGRLADLAKQDQARPADVASQKVLADAWWDGAEKLAGRSGGAMRRRAAEWYSRAADGLTGLEQGVARKRITESTATGATQPTVAVSGQPGELLRDTNDRRPPEKFIRPTPQQIDEAMADARRSAKEVETKFKIKFQEVQTEHFLIFTDWDRREFEFLRTHVEGAYAAVGHQLDFPTHLNIFVGKLPVYMFASHDAFKRYAKEIDQFPDVSDNLLGYHTGNRSGVGHMAMWKPDVAAAGGDVSLAEWRWGYVLTHEFTHAFIARYRTNGFIPRWLNEGIAEVVASSQYAKQSILPVAKDRAGKLNSLADVFDDKGPFNPADYSVAQTLVEFLVSIGNRAQFLRYLNDIKDGMSADDALQKEYSMDRTQLEVRWRYELSQTK